MELDSSTNHKTKSLKDANSKPSGFLKLLVPLAWLIFLSNLITLFYYFPNTPQWSIGTIFKMNSLCLIIWTIVAFFSAIVQSYATKYMRGFKNYHTFLILCFAFSISVMLFVASNHIIALLFFWLTMGIIMSKLIGINPDWKEAKEASLYARNNYLLSTLFLSIGLLLLVFNSGQFSVESILEVLDSIPIFINTIASLCIILAAIIQSAIFPFHKWLLSAMTSPTPASALMHAGFVNGSGILLTMFSPLLFKSNILLLIFIIGGLTAILAQFSKLLQVNVKQKLACSTSAQMSFMIMQCGLGFFSAAVTHLILHGFYKAYLFLSAGEEIENTIPTKPDTIKIKIFQSISILIISILGGGLFALLTGKGTTLNSGLFLTFIVAITVGQVTYNIINQSTLSNIKKLIMLPVLIIVGISAYAIIFNGITLLMNDMPMVNKAVELTSIHILFGITFLVAFAIMLFGIYRKYPWLYIKLLNNSQPYSKSILSYKK